MPPTFIPLSNVRLSLAEASGQTSIDAGLRPARQLQAPRRDALASNNVRFAHPPIRQRVPSPTATRSAPRRR